MTETCIAESPETLRIQQRPFSKADVVERVTAGEQLVCLTERAANGTEIRSAAATASTIPIQRQYFETTREPDSSIEIRGLVDVLAQRLDSLRG